MNELAVNVVGVSKDFRLPHERNNSIKSAAIHPFRKRSFEKQHALKNIDFNVKRGEFFGIVGRNGSGKSTLLKIIAGIYQPNKGHVTVDGKLVPFIELGVGFNPELTGRDNVYLNGALLGFSEKEVDGIYDEIVDFAELEDHMDQKLKNYSSGMQVRLAFSMAVRAKADILLIDEVLAVGDADFQRKCFDYFKKLKKEQTTVVFVTHDMEAVREYCDRAMLIEDNKILYVGETYAVAEQYIKLFSGNHNDEQGEEESDRWGDGVAKISNVLLGVNNESVEITLGIAPHQKLDEIVAGFRVRDAAGKEIFGTNTKRERQGIVNLIAGMNTSVSWQLPNILSDGKYYVDVTLQYADEITVIDWWNGAKSFQIKKNRHLPYPIDPGFVTKVTYDK